MLTKIAVIEQCIENDKRAIFELECHMKKLYEMRDKELEAEGMEIEEWEQAVKELKNRCKKN